MQNMFFINNFETVFFVCDLGCLCVHMCECTQNIPLPVLLIILENHPFADRFIYVETMT